MSNELEILKKQHELAVLEMIKAVDKVNELKMKMWEIETRKMKEEVDQG
jgi:hypothetical protein